MKKNKTLLRRLLSFTAASIMTVSALLSGITAAAAENGEKMLKANKDGNFKVLQVSDVQDHATADGKKKMNFLTLSTIRLAVNQLKPDLIVLTGDNIHRADSLEDFEYSVKTLTKTFKGTPFAVTYGNHDLERNKDNDEYLTYVQEQEIYEKYGAVKLCQDGLVCDDTSDYSTSKYGTGYIDIYNHDGTAVVNRVILINSGTYEVDEASEDGNVNNKGFEGYGRPGVNAKTYKNTDYGNVVAAVEKWTHEGIKCISYQHIPMQEFYYSGIIVEGGEKDVLMNGRQPDGIKDHYYKNTVKNTVTNRFVEPCGCSYYSTEELYNAFAGSGDVLGVFYGHDHTNTIMGKGTCYGKELIQGYGGGLLVYPGDYGEDSPEADYNPMVCLYTLSGDTFTKETKPFFTLLKTHLFGGGIWNYIVNTIKSFFESITNIFQK